MQLTLRLYDQSDADLICLRLRYGKKFPKIVRECLTAHIHGSDFTIRFPDDVHIWAKRPDGHVDVNVTFDSKRDADVVEWMSGVRGKSKGNVVKTIVRSMYSRFPYELFRPPYTGGGEPLIPVIPVASKRVRNDPDFHTRMDAADERAAKRKSEKKAKTADSGKSDASLNNSTVQTAADSEPARSLSGAESSAKEIPAKTPTISAKQPSPDNMPDRQDNRQNIPHKFGRDDKTHNKDGGDVQRRSSQENSAESDTRAAEHVSPSDMAGKDSSEETRRNEFSGKQGTSDAIQSIPDNEKEPNTEDTQNEEQPSDRIDDMFDMLSNLMH